MSLAFDPALAVASCKTLVFVHIPKTGGTTLDHVIQRQYAGRPVLWISYNRPELVSQFEAMDTRHREELCCLAGHFPFGLHEKLPRDATYVTLLRDPVERFISEYKHVVRWPQQGLWNPPVERTKSLDEFLDNRIETNGLDVQTRFISGDIPPPGGTPPPFDPLPADALDRAKQNLRNRFLVVGLMERFDESLLLMKRRLDWSKHIYYLRRRTAPDIAAARNISPDTVARIRSFNAADMELVRYGADILEQAVRGEGTTFHKELRRVQMVNSAIHRLTEIWKRSGLQRYGDLPGLRHARVLVHRLM